jgi:putative ABC transport system permease protein
MARRYWPGSSPLGRRLRLSKTQPWLTIVGIVDDISSPELVVMGRDLWIYRPFTGSLKRAELLLRTRGETPALVSEIATAARSVDPEIRVGDASTVDAEIAWSMQGQRFVMHLLASVALLALILAAIGLYGVIAYTVSQRTREMGIRIALGARPASVIRLVVAQGLGVTCIGVILGLAGAAVATRIIRNLLFSVGPLDPVTFVAAGLVLGVVALVAAFIPARRVSRVDPVIALRAE